MNLQPYPINIAHSHLYYEFESIGPKGLVRKAVSYIHREADGINYFNLGFGDVNQLTGKIDDLTVSNNLDREKVLATVAATVLDFTDHYPDALIYAKGSTPSRTRLY